MQDWVSWLAFAMFAVPIGIMMLIDMFDPNGIRGFSSDSPARPRTRPRGADWSRTRRAVGRRDGWRCVACRRPVREYPVGVTGPDAFQVDHIVPFSRGGSDYPSNLQTLCRTCNLRKGVRTRRY